MELSEQIIRMRQLMGIENPDDVDFLLFEGLIKTTPPEKAKNLLDRFFQSISKNVNSKILGNITTQTSSKITIEKDDELIVSILPLEDNKSNIKYLLKLINNLGYVISRIKYKEKTDNDIIPLNYNENYFYSLVKEYKNLEQFDIIIKPKFDTGKQTSGKSKKLYHITLQNRVPRILKQGLVPRSESKLSAHPDRIYFGRTLSDVTGLIHHYVNYYNLKKETGVVMAILEIDTSNLSDLELHSDPNYKQSGVYVLDNIPPDAIKVIRKDIKIN